MVVCPQAQEYGMTRFKKECFKCNTIKPLGDFYKHPKMADGHVNKCKECNKNDVLNNRNKNLEKYRAYDRERGKIPERIKANAEINRAWRAEDVRRALAHSKVARAIRSGQLDRQPCIRCGEKKSVAHHEDYDKPFEIMWLCQPCHKQRHKELKKDF
jgi:hypothetical protein